MNFQEKQKKIFGYHIRKLNHIVTKSQVNQLIELQGNPRQLILRNLFSGISKGIGVRNRCYDYNSNDFIALRTLSNTQSPCHWSILI